MKSKIAVFSLFLVFVLSCSRSSDNAGDTTSTILFGNFVETSPVAGRARVGFNDGNKVVLYPASSGFGKQYVFQIIQASNKIILDDNISSPSVHHEYYFKIYSANKFEITNFIDENQSNMIFEK